MKTKILFILFAFFSVAGFAQEKKDVKMEKVQETDVVKQNPRIPVYTDYEIYVTQDTDTQTLLLDCTESPQTALISIKDVWGNVVATDVCCMCGKLVIDLSILLQGTYTVEVEIGEIVWIGEFVHE